MAREISSHSPATIKVVCWLLSMASACFVIVRFATKLAMTKKWSIDDTMIIFALAFSITQSVLLTMATSYGYGNLILTTDIDQLLGQEKFIYLSNIMFFLSMCFGMLATSHLIMNLSPGISHHIISHATSGATIVWSIIAVFGFAFQCGLPTPWEFNGQCIHQRAFYTFVICANLLIEGSLILQPGLVVWNLKLAMRRKVIIIACFFSRFLVVIALVGLIISVWASGTDAASALSFGVTICTILADNFSIMAASMPYLRPFLQGLEHGMMGAEIAPRRTNAEGPYVMGTGNSYGLSKSCKSAVVMPRLQAIHDSSQWKFEQLDDSSKAVSMADIEHGGHILQTSEFTVESHPIMNRLSAHGSAM